MDFPIQNIPRVAFIGILEHNKKGNFISRKLIHPYLIWKNKLITNLIDPKYTVYKRKNNKCPDVENWSHQNFIEVYLFSYYRNC